VEGLVKVSTLSGDYFHYDPASQSLVGERTGTIYSLADGLEVQIVRVDVDERKVDFEIVSHQPMAKRKSSSGRKSVKSGSATGQKNKKKRVDRTRDKKEPQRTVASGNKPGKKVKRRSSRKKAGTKEGASPSHSGKSSAANTTARRTKKKTSSNNANDANGNATQRKKNTRKSPSDKSNTRRRR